MFSIALTPTYWWPVTVQVAQDGGAFAESTFEVEFTRLDDDEFKALLDDVRARGRTDRETVPDLVRSFRNVINGSGVQVPFNAESLAVLLKISGVASAIVRAYFQSRTEAARGN